MGQYYLIANIKKHEYMYPHDFGAGAKLMEFAYPLYPSTILSALAVLLADGDNRGGGDLRSENPIIGSWAYDKIVVAGDYADPRKKVCKDRNVYRVALEDGWTNISVPVFLALMDDSGEYTEQIREECLNYSDWNITPILISLAKGYKAFEENPEFGKTASEFFRKLFPEDKDYYRVINGIIKHHVKKA